MFNPSAGEINDRLVRLGTRHSVIYLAKGDPDMLIGGGGQWVIPTLEQQIREFHINMDRVRYLLIGHSHYDHCGAVPYLQRRYRHLEVLASRGAAKLFTMEKAVNNMSKFSRKAMEEMGVPMQFNGISLEFDGIRVVKSLQEGDRVDLGTNLIFEVYETPGHSRCSIMLYVPEKKWLFCSDSIPLPANDGKNLICTASEGYNTFLTSLKKMETLPIGLCAWEHFGYMTGDEAQDIIPRAIKATTEYKQLLQDRLEQSKDIELTAQWAAREWLSATGMKFLPYAVLTHIQRTMVENAVEERLEESETTRS